MKQHTRAIIEKMFPGFYGKVEKAIYQNMVTLVPPDEEVEEIFWFLLGNLSFINVPNMLSRFSQIYETERNGDSQRPIILICEKSWKKMEQELKIK